MADLLTINQGCQLAGWQTFSRLNNTMTEDGFQMAGWQTSHDSTASVLTDLLMIKQPVYSHLLKDNPLSNRVVREKLSSGKVQQDCTTVEDSL
jgi:hypothetical protein